MASVTSYTQLFEQAHQAPWTIPVGPFLSSSYTNEVIHKRKPEDDTSVQPPVKKQKLQLNTSDESFRTAQTQDLGLPQPIGVPKAAIPLNDGKAEPPSC